MDREKEGGEREKVMEREKEGGGRERVMERERYMKREIKRMGDRERELDSVMEKEIDR